MAWYLETSAFLKLVVAEPESDALRAWFALGEPCWSSQLLLTEAHRAGTRLGVEQAAIDEVLGQVGLTLPSAATFQAAAVLGPAGLRSLDALHLATALEYGEQLDGMVAYDTRITEGARVASIRILSPGSPPRRGLGTSAGP